MMTEAYASTKRRNIALGSVSPRNVGSDLGSHPTEGLFDRGF